MSKGASVAPAGQMEEAHILFSYIAPSNCLEKRTLLKKEEFHAWIPVSVGRTKQRAEEKTLTLDYMRTD